MNNANEAFFIVLAMGAVILFCRAFPFLFFSGRREGRGEKDAAAQNKDAIKEADPSRKAHRFNKAALLNFVEKTVPPAAMTVLAFNALGGAFRANPREGIFVLIASAFTALLHLWKRNSLVSIIGGTVLYMILIKI